MDADGVDEIQDISKKLERMRYSIINCSIGFVAKCCYKGGGYKQWAGDKCYLFAALNEFFTGGIADEYRISVINSINGQ